MNVTDMANSTTEVTTNAVTEGVTKTPYTEANTTHNLVVTTALPPTTDSTITVVVIFMILLTLAVLGFLLYRYLCHNKGAYRTDELALGEDFEEDLHNQTNEIKEYFI